MVFARFCISKHFPSGPLSYGWKMALLLARLIMPPTLKKLMGHIAFLSVCACVTLFVPTVTFKPLKLES